VPLSKYRLHVIVCLAQGCAGCGKLATTADYQTWANEYEQLASSGTLFTSKWRQQSFWCCAEQDVVPRIQELVNKEKKAVTVDELARELGMPRSTCTGILSRGRNKFWNLKGGTIVPCKPEDTCFCPQ
jgi:hypothetical protein